MFMPLKFLISGKVDKNKSLPLAALRIKWRGYPRSVNADKARRDKVIEIMKARKGEEGRPF